MGPPADTNGGGPRTHAVVIVGTGFAGIGMAIMGTTLAVAAIQANGTPEQWGEWIPQCFGTEAEPKVAAFCVSA